MVQSQSSAESWEKKARLLDQVIDIVEEALPRRDSKLLEYHQLQAAVASGRPVFAANALERLVGRCWDDLHFAGRARLLALAVMLRSGPTLLSESGQKESPQITGFVLWPPRQESNLRPFA